MLENFKIFCNFFIFLDPSESLDNVKPIPKLIDQNKWAGEDEDDDIKVSGGKFKELCLTSLSFELLSSSESGDIGNTCKYFQGSHGLFIWYFRIAGMQKTTRKKMKRN